MRRLAGALLTIVFLQSADAEEIPPLQQYLTEGRVQDGAEAMLALLEADPDNQLAQISLDMNADDLTSCSGCMAPACSPGWKKETLSIQTNGKKCFEGLEAASGPCSSGSIEWTNPSDDGLTNVNITPAVSAVSRHRSIDTYCGTTSASLVRRHNET